MKYDHLALEKKWQKYWEENKTFKTDLDASKPKYYVLDMFPYPSGSGLHVGHVEGYTATDILARHKRKKGFNVLHPMGWDSFGLPAEQYAIRTGTHPRETTEKNINTFRRELKSLGFSYDWEREFATSDPSYYKWTQWIFTVLFEKGLAYEAEMTVNYCPALGTVLSNEEVENGRAKEGGHPIERRPLRQWILKITAYAERLIDDLKHVDWPESLKKLQTNWIGKSEGAWVDFSVEGSEKPITVFTTRPDTLFGATFMVLAPEHPLLAAVKDAQVKEYIAKAVNKSDLDRTDLNKDKSGVFSGLYAINPVNQEKIPLWVSDYVLMGYGTGAVMAVPAHDERDFEFAKKYGLPIRPVILPENEKDKAAVLASEIAWPHEGSAINSANEDISLDGLSVDKAKERITGWLEEKKSGRRGVTYKLRDWLFSRQRYWGEPFPILHFEDGTKRALSLDELPLTPPELTDFKPSGDGKSPLSKVPEWVSITDPKTGKPALRETNTMPQWAGSCWYYLRFADPKNLNEAFSKEAESYWLPVDMYIGGVEHAVLHLLYARFWHKVLYDAGIVSTIEPFQTLRNQGLIVARSFQRANLTYVPPEDVIEKNGKFYERATNEELTSQIEKMSKSKLNGVTPEECLQDYGADALRLYEMFLGPLEKEKIWNSDAISGCRRFLNRVYDLVNSEKVVEGSTDESKRLSHRLIKGVTSDIEDLQFNTAIAKMMEFINEYSKLPAYPKEGLIALTHALSPFAPHMAEEMWRILSQKGELSYAPYPEVDDKLCEDSVITYVVQINGKVRGRFELPKDQPQEVILESAKNHEIIKGYIDDKIIQKVIFVPNKLLNIVVS